MRPVPLSPVPMDEKAQLRWCIDAIQTLARASKDSNPNVYADGYTITNVTERRTIDCDTITTAELADAVATFLQDHKRRGAKGES